MSTVAIIPARGGSKGLPNKNLLPLGGISLVGRAIRSAVKAELVDEVIVTSDSEEILEEALFWGATPHLRSSVNSSDTATSEAALLEVLGSMEKVPEIIVFMQATSPFTSPESISGAVAFLNLKPENSSVIGVVNTHKFTWQDVGESIDPIAHTLERRLRRQDLPPTYVETGSFYVFRALDFYKHQTRFCSRVFPFVQPEVENFEIDSREDFETAAKLLATRDRRNLPSKIGALIVDFDGVLTTNRALIGVDGEERVEINRSDGHWLSRLKSRGVRVLILSSDASGLASYRARMLGIESITSTEMKAKELINWAKNNSVVLDSCIYIGNDVNDVPPMAICGWSACPHDASSPARRVADYVAQRDGGMGAVQEICELIEGSADGWTAR